jgi:hypothetical protein
MITTRVTPVKLLLDLTSGHSISNKGHSSIILKLAQMAPYCHVSFATRETTKCLLKLIVEYNAPNHFANIRIE